VIPNGMPATLFDRAVSRAVQTEGPVFATILTGWAGRKNGQVAIEAFARLRQSFPLARLVMFGAGHGVHEPAAAWAHERGIEGGIEFVGQIPHATLLDRLSTEVNVLLHPALEEAQPMALIEAMALGIPVIAGKDAGGVPWTLDDGRGGILVDVRSSTSVVEAMLRLARNPAESQRVGDAGRDIALRRHHIARVADAYEQIYAQLGEQAFKLGAQER
jgi:glycosyltransferase involved in cell wall biosynthesis